MFLAGGASEAARSGDGAKIAELVNLHWLTAPGRRAMLLEKTSHRKTLCFE